MRYTRCPRRLQFLVVTTAVAGLSAPSARPQAPAGGPDPREIPTRLVVTGASRAGKAAMMTAALDERLMGAPVVTGGGGIGAYRFSGEGRGGREGLDLMMTKYPNWFSPHLHEFRGHTDRLPFDYAKHGHAFTEEGWSAMLDFADRHLRGLKADRTFDRFASE